MLQRCGSVGVGVEDGETVRVVVYQAVDRYGGANVVQEA